MFEFRGRARGLLRNTNIWELDLIFIGHLANDKGDSSTHFSYLATFYQSGDLVSLPTLDRCCVCEEAVKVVEAVHMLVDICEMLGRSDVHLKIPTTTRTGTQAT